MGEDAKKIADSYKKHFACKPYLPSNGSEGEMFDEDWCSHCKRDADFRNGKEEPDENGVVGCPILALSFSGQPKEWVHDEEGTPTCTAFEQLGDSPRK